MGRQKPPEDNSGLQVLRIFVTAHVQSKHPDLSLKQLAVFLTCYEEEKKHTPLLLAVELQIKLPLVQKAVATLVEFGLVRTESSKLQCLVEVRRTRTGSMLYRQLKRAAHPQAAVT